MSRLALVFDVETSGLIKNTVPFPHILQLSFLLYDTMDKHLIMTYDTFVKPTIPVKVTEEITRLTGIVQEDVDNGRPIRQVLDDFFQVLN